MIERGEWKTLDDVFWTVIPFGTGGRRGLMHPVGSNAINERTMGESAQGLADYVRTTAGGAAAACGIAYDSRHNSRRFAELCAEVMVGNGLKVYFLDGIRSTPELSFLVRRKQCACGIMITASHNPPSDNAIKAYWSTGGQLYPPHDRGVIEAVNATVEIRRRPWAEAVAAGAIEFVQSEIDEAYLQAVGRLVAPGPRAVKILYTPLHGVGGTSALPAMERAGFGPIEVYAPQATPDGDFPNVPGRVANPENEPVFAPLVEHARTSGAELVMATDPDADRLGVAAPVRIVGGKAAKEYRFITGNQLGALLAEHLLSRAKKAGGLRADAYIVSTLVTTPLIRRIAEAYGARCFDEVLVGFRWIVRVIDEQGPAGLVLATEESHGYLAGDHARDKDAAVAAVLTAELAAECRARGKTLVEQLESLFWQYGMHVERTRSTQMPGSAGMARMQRLMAGLRSDPPATLGGLGVKQVRDYGRSVKIVHGNESALGGPRGDLLIFDLDQAGNFAAIRPSGTEPKVKCYLFAAQAPELQGDLEETKRELEARLDGIEADFAARVKATE
jgi:phosphoglucomutase/phosphomannomutase